MAQKIHVAVDEEGDPQTAILEVSKLPVVGTTLFQATAVLESKHPDPNNRLAGYLKARSQEANFDWGGESLPSFKITYFE